MPRHRPLPEPSMERWRCSTCDRRRHQEAGSVTADAIIALMAHFVITVALLNTLLSLWTGWQVMQTTLEVDQSWANICRVLIQDGHSSIAPSIVYGSLNLTMPNGVAYRYLVNTSNQLVRTQQGGGSSVVGSLIKSMSTSVKNGMVTVTCIFTNQTNHIVTFATLKTFL